MVNNDITPPQPETKRKDSKPVSRTAYKKPPASASTKKTKGKPMEEVKSEINIPSNEALNETSEPMTNQPTSLT